MQEEAEATRTKIEEEGSRATILAVISSTKCKRQEEQGTIKKVLFH